MVNFGIIACSRVAQRWFIPALLSSSNATLGHIGSREVNKAKAFSQQFGCHKFGTYEDVLADPEVNAVYISTPPSEHVKWVVQAAKTGKHVLCEKPAFPDLETATKTVIYCRSMGVRLMENYAFKYHPQHALVKAIISNKQIGEVRFIHAEFTYPFPPSPEDIRWNPELGGGVFHDSAGYPVAAATLLLSTRPTAIFSQVCDCPQRQVDQSFSFLLDFGKTGQVATGLAAFGTHYRSRYSVLGTAGRIEVVRAFSVPPDMKPTVVLETDAGEKRIAVEPANQFRLLLDDFCLQISTNPSEGLKDFEGDILFQQQIMDAAAISHRKKRSIEISTYPPEFIPFAERS